MRDVLTSLDRWCRAGDAAGLAVVTSTWASAPRPPGAAMAVGPGGEVVGSVSGGCVEAEVHELCVATAADGTTRSARFGVSDDSAYAAGLPCGGTVSLRIGRVDPALMPWLPRLAARVHAGEPARVSVMDGAPFLRPGAAEDAALVVAFEPPPRMLVFGATEHAAATAGIGAFLGFRVTVCDARPVFATTERFPSAHEVVVDWPHRYLTAEAAAGRVDRRTAICVLTHDPKFDVPALEVALGLDVAYVGAMGSRRTHDDRLDRLIRAGVPPESLDRLASPVGLDLGARTPQETAVSIAAEIVALRRGGSGARLSSTAGPIHRTDTRQVSVDR